MGEADSGSVSKVLRAYPCKEFLMHCTIINSGYIYSLSKHVASNFQTSNDVSILASPENSVNVVSDKGEYY